MTSRIMNIRYSGLIYLMRRMEFLACHIKNDLLELALIIRDLGLLVHNT